MIMRLKGDWFNEKYMTEPEIKVLLLDQDPISRHVLGSGLRKTGRFKVSMFVEGYQNVPRAITGQVDVAVVTVGPRDDFQRVTRELSARDIRVLLVGIGWSRPRLDGAFIAGAAGCVVKDTDIGGLTAAVRAVASGYTVLSPQLHGLYAPSQQQAVGASGHGGPAAQSPSQLLRTLTGRERTVLSLLAEGLSTVEVAARLNVTPATVKSHVSHCLTKLGARNRLEVVLMMHRVALPDRDYGTCQRRTA